MDSFKRESTTDLRRPALVSIIVFVSIAVPLIVAGWSLQSALSGKPLGRPAAESKIYQGSLRNGELWFTVFQIHRNGIAFDCQIRRLDLETGIERPTEYSVSGIFVYPLWLNNELFAVSQSSIYRMADGKTHKICDIPVTISQFHTMPFVLDGQVTTIVELQSGGFRLLHLVDDHWVDGREILLPGPGTVWQNDEDSDQPVLRPASNTVPAPVRMCWVMAVQQGTQVHVLQTDTSNFAAYRNGFEFADAALDSASALHPANVVQEFSGWEPIPGVGNNPRLMWMACDEQGVLFCSMNPSTPLLRLTTDHRWERLETPATQTRHPNRVLVADPASSISYLIDEDQMWSSAVIHRMEQHRVHQAHLTLPGTAPEYLSRWMQAAVGLLVSWLLHLLLLLAGGLWSQRGKERSIWHFGVQQATLASTGRRGTAFGLDALFILLIPIFTIWIQLPAGKAVDNRTLGTQLLNLEMSLDSVINKTPGPGINPYWELKSLFSPLFELDYTAEIAEALILFGLLLWLESRTGNTPGKWLVGIRTVRSTLRPAGFFRIVVRRLLLWVDMPLFLSPLPGAISVLLSNHNQRIGDRVADTIVICIDSIRDETGLTRIDQ